MSDYAERSLLLLLRYLEIKNLAWLAFNFLSFFVHIDTSLLVSRAALGWHFQDVAVNLLLIITFALPILKADYLHVKVLRLLFSVTASVN